MAKDFSYEIVENIAVLSTSNKGWTKELNLISWNGREPKYDIREWAPDHEKMGKGVTLSEKELMNLIQAANVDVTVKKLDKAKSGTHVVESPVKEESVVINDNDLSLPF